LVADSSSGEVTSDLLGITYYARVRARYAAILSLVP